MVERVKKIGLSLSVIVLFVLYSRQKQPQPLLVESADLRTGTTLTPVPATTAPTTTRSVSSNSVTPTASARSMASSNAPLKKAATTEPSPTREQQVPTATTVATVASTDAASANGMYRDGTYTGDEADANWGYVQVQVTVSDGQISDVQFLEAPDHRSRSRSINQRAMPRLIQEAVQAQQADVDIVSGATDTSEAFIRSLEVALDEAAA